MSDNANSRQPRKPLNCDDVSHIMRALERFRATAVRPEASHVGTTAGKLACVIEIMDILDFGFEDEDAVFNALSEIGITQRTLARSPDRPRPSTDEAAA